MASRVKRKGLFITFEGAERSGKSTQAKLLKRYLVSKGYTCIFIREPGSTVIGERIRRILLNRKNTHISNIAEMLLYMTARAQIVHEIIQPSLAAGKVVICDRFLDSTLAYQGYGLGMDTKMIRSVGSAVTQGVSPHLTLLLDMDHDNGLFDKRYKKDRIEMRSRAYHQRVRKGYLALARREPRRIKIVRMQPTVAATQSSIRNIVDQWLSR